MDDTGDGSRPIPNAHCAPVQFALTVPAIKDRVAQTAAVLVLEPIFEADLQPQQYAYRPDRSALDAVEHVHKPLNTGHGQIVDADLSGYFDSIACGREPPRSDSSRLAKCLTFAAL